MRNLNINLKYIRHLFYQYRRVFYLLLLVFGFAYPIVMFLSKPSLSEITIYPEYYLANLPMFMIPHVSLWILFVVSFVVVYLVFAYTNNKANMDNYLSLPISKENLFFNQFIFAFLLAFIPFALAWITGWATGQYLYPNLYQDLARVKNIDYHVLEMLGQLALVGLFLPVLQGVALFALVNTPSVVDGVLYGLGLHIIPWFVYFSANILGNRYIWGFSDYVLNESVVGKLLFNRIFFETFDGSTLHTLDVDFWFIAWVFVGFVLFFINQKLFAKRSVESIGSNKVNNWFYPLIINLSTYLLIVVLLETLVFSQYMFQTRNYLYPLLIGLIFYFVLDMIRHRMLSKVVRMLVTYLVIFALALGTFFALDVKVSQWLSPEGNTSNIAKVELYTDVSFAFTKRTTSTGRSNSRYFSEHFESEDADIIQTIVDVQNRSKELYYRFFGNRWGVFNDLERYTQLLTSDSNYLYYVQQNPFKLRTPMRDYFSINHYYEAESPNIPVSIMIVYTDQNSNTKTYYYEMPLAWLDDVLNTLVPQK